MKLAQRPEDIRIGDVVLAMERMSIEDERASGTGDFSRIFDVALEAFVSVLNQHTLADMVRNKRAPFLAGLSAKQAKSKSKAVSRKAAVITDFVRSERTGRAKPRGVPK
jgi:Rrf2 family nitric oxide-sensitive transcriptional repressor